MIDTLNKSLRDELPETQQQFFDLLAEAWDKAYEIDKVYGQDSVSATKNAALQEAVGEVPEDFQEVVSRIVEAVKAHAPNGVTQAGAIQVLNNALSREFPDADTWVKNRVEALKKEREEQGQDMSTEEKERLRREFADAVEAYDAYLSVLKLAAPEDFIEKLPKLQKKKGAIGGGHRMPRLKGAYTFHIDGNVQPSGTKIGDVAQTVKLTATKLKEAIVEQNEDFDFANPPTRFEVNVTSGEGDKAESHRVVGVMQTSDDSSDDDSDDDDLLEEEDED